MNGAIWSETRGPLLGDDVVVAALPTPWHEERWRDDREYSITVSTAKTDEEDVTVYGVGHAFTGPEAIYLRAADAAAHFRAVTESYGHSSEVVSAALFAVLWGSGNNQRELNDLTRFSQNDRGDK